MASCMTEVSVPPAWLDRLVWGLVLLALTPMLLLLAAEMAMPCCQISRQDSVRDDALMVGSAASLFVVDNPGLCPAPTDLHAGGYLDPSRRITDAWDHEFRISCEGDDVRVYSAGPDGRFGTDDDIE